MSQKVVAEIINKALADGSFRRRLSSDPNAVLAGYELTQDEVEAIRLSLEAGASAAPASDLDPRISRARLPLDALSHLFAPAGPESTGAMPEPIPHPGEGPHPIGAMPEPIPHPAQGPEGVGSLPVPIPHEAQGPQHVGAMPEPIPHPGEGPHPIGAMPEPIPHPGEGPHPIGAMPEPIPHPAQGPEGVGSLPIPIPHEAHGPGVTGAMPEPIPHPAQGHEEVGSLPGPLPHPAQGAADLPAHAGGSEVASSPVPQPVPHEAQPVGGSVDLPAGQADATPIPRPEAGLHGPGGDGAQVTSSAVPQPVPQPSGSSAVAATDGDAPPGGGESGPTPTPPAEDPFPDEPVQA
jgi:hypothetical protein